MVYYLDHVGEESEFDGTPFPAAGKRVVFDAGKFRAWQARPPGDGDPGLRDRPGLVVFEDPRDVLSWPCRIWRVGDLEQAVRPAPAAPYLSVCF